jgi:hypothetical protein
MRNTVYNILTAALLGLLIFTGCAKDEDEPEDPTTTTTGGVATYDFKWTPNNGSTVTADEAYFSTATNNIYAAKSGTANSVEIILPDFNITTYSISSSSGNSLEFLSNSTSHQATSGTVKITANSGNKISGNFAVGFSSGTLTSLSGQFTDVPQK